MPARTGRHVSASCAALCAVAVVLWVASSPASGQGGGGGAVGPGRSAGAPAPAGQGRVGRGAAPERDGASPPAAIGTGEISGVVFVLGNGAPVRRAQVTLSGPELRGQRTTVTDDQGRFTFQVVPAGRFNLTANKAGHVSSSYGAKRPGRPGTPIQLGDGQKVEKLGIALPRGGVITGAVVDQYGEPAPNTQVRALRYVMQTGERTLSFSGQDTTDDRGVYRIFSLQPGEYVLSAIPRNLNPATDMRQLIMSQATTLQESLAQMPGGGSAFVLGNLGAIAGSPAAQQAMDQLAQQLGVPDGPQAAAYAPVYFPGTATPSGATTIALGISEERSGVDFQLQLVPTAKVQGSVVSQDGTLPSNIQLSLLAVGAGGTPIEPQPGTSVTRVDGQGQFTFRDVTPGQYTLQARAVVRRAEPAETGRGGGPGRGGAGPVPPNQIAQVLWASADVPVSGRDLTDLQLVLQPGMTVGGRVEFRGDAAPPADLSGVRLTFSPRGPQNTGGPGGMPVAVVDEFGRFTLTGVAPGRYTVSGTAQAGRGGAGRGTAGSNTNWTLSSALIDGRDVLDFPLEIAPHENIKDALVTFTNRTQDLSGRIQDAMGRPTADFTIVVFPTDTRYWLPRARRIASTRPGTDGSFALRDLPAGDYRLTAVTDVEPGEWYDPNFLNQLVPVSLPITLREGEKKVQDIKVAN
jgi:protocatechuate 3,4-dioxygenase beta subunit